MSYYLGIDPDLHHAGIALLNSKSGEGRLWVAKAPSKLKGEEANVAMAQSLRHIVLVLGWVDSVDSVDSVEIVIESQKIRPGTSVNPQDIVMLAQAAGVAVGVLSGLSDNISLVQPQDWKGSIPKEAHHAVIREHYRIEKGQLGPHESHLLDAVGLAAWGWLRDSLPRSPDRNPQSRLLGSVLSKQRLARLPRLSLELVATLG